MKMTKKQIAALQRIIDREASRIEWKKQNRKEGDPEVEKTAGAHPSHEKVIVTDGYVAVVFSEMPAELPEAERNDSLYDLIRNDIYRPSRGKRERTIIPGLCPWRSRPNMRTAAQSAAFSIPSSWWTLWSLWALEP